MKLSRREGALISFTILLLAGVVLFKLVSQDLELLLLWPSASSSQERLTQAQSLIAGEEKLRLQAVEASKLENAFSLDPDPQKRAMSAISRLSTVAESVGIKLEELKPGLVKQEGRLSILTVRLTTKSSLIALTDLLKAIKSNLPMVRIMKLNLVSSSNGMIEANMDGEFLLPGVNSGLINQNKNRMGSPALSVHQRGEYLKLARERGTGEPEKLYPDWLRLELAFTAGNQPDGENSGYSQPHLLGLVSIGSQVQALIGLGNDSWYFFPGQSQAGIELLNTGSDRVTIRYQGRLQQLSLNSN